MTASPAAHPLTPDRARRRFLLLTLTRWLPVGLVIGIFGLLALERGLTVGEVLTYAAAQGVVVLLLELPTSGFADAFGRRPLLLVAGAVNLVTAWLYLRADSFAGFALAAAAMGVYRALDSGPLEAWFVDAVHAGDPGADVDQSLARQNTVLGGSIAVGAVLGGGLVACHPLPAYSPLALPIALYAAFGAVHLALTAALVTEVPAGAVAGRGGGLRRALDSARATPRQLRATLGLLGHDRVLLGILGVEVAWVWAMTVFENLMPLRLAELLGSTAAAGQWNGPVAAAGWGVFAAGATLAGRLAGRLGVARTAILARVLNGAGAAVMGLAAGPVALVAAYGLTYALHGAGGPMHGALLHRRAEAANRASVLSLNSMVAFGAGAIAGPTLGWLSGATSTQTAMVVGGLVSVVGALGYLPAGRAERDRRG